MSEQICPKCSQPMQMYYKPWCPRCDKPQRKPVETLNLIQALEHIETITDDKSEYPARQGFKDRMWKFLCDVEVIRYNDSYSWFGRPEDEDRCDPQVKKDIDLFCNTFDIDANKGILLDISW